MRPLTHERLRELLSYDRETGVFTRRVAVGKTKAGDPFGSLNGHGYLHGWLDGRNLYTCHTLAWFYVHGVWPEGPLDHENRVKTDNRIDNLRPTTTVLNGQNSSPRAGRTLPTGVSRNGTGFVARIKIGDRQVALGTFKTVEEAAAAYTSTKELFHEGFSGY